MKLMDKVALVTGAGSGIGRAIALRFAAEGARVVLNDLHKDVADKTLAEIGEGHGSAIQADVADSGQVRAMFAEIERAYDGRLDILVNNAGIAGTSAADRDKLRGRSDTRIMELMSGQGIQTHWDITQEMTDEAWHRMIGVHLNGTFFCTREALRLMSRRNEGSSSTCRAWRRGDSRACRTTAPPRRASSASLARSRARWDHGRSASTRSAPGSSTRR